MEDVDEVTLAKSLSILAQAEQVKAGFLAEAADRAKNEALKAKLLKHVAEASDMAKSYRAAARAARRRARGED